MNIIPGSILNAIQNQVEMADVFRSSGKIYVVIAILLIIFVGIFFYLFRLEKKIAKFEKEVSSGNDGGELNE